MIERALLTPDELKSLPKGTFVVMKTGFYPMKVALKLYYMWSIAFPEASYSVADKGNRKVTYADRESLANEIERTYPSLSVKSSGVSMTEEEREKRFAGNVHAAPEGQSRKSGKDNHGSSVPGGMVNSDSNLAKEDAESEIANKEVNNDESSVDRI